MKQTKPKKDMSDLRWLFYFLNLYLKAGFFPVFMCMFSAEPNHHREHTQITELFIFIFPFIIYACLEFTVFVKYPWNANICFSVFFLCWHFQDKFHGWELPVKCWESKYTWLLCPRCPRDLFPVGWSKVQAKHHFPCFLFTPSINCS